MMRPSFSLSALLLTVFFAAPVTADDPSSEGVIDRLDVRFAPDAKAEEVPDFQKHVAPLLGKMSCNSRACHGSFQGQGGFQLSLFGYDFKTDHDNLTKGDDPRVDVDDPAFSLMLQKPTLNYPHEGGKRMTEGSWEHRALLRWIEAGAPYLKDNTPVALTRLEVTPEEVWFGEKDATTQLRAVAVWADGTREDVTPLCRFEVNDDQIASVTGTGMLTAGEPGDTHAVISYDSAVVPIPIFRPHSHQTGERYPQVAVRTEVDRLVIDKLSKLGILPSEVCSDEEFLRRVSLDITGTLPTPERIEAFLAETSPDKRERVIDELLETPAYSAWWTTQICDWTGNNGAALNNVSPMRNQPTQEWYEWIRTRVEANVGYDDIAEGIVLGVGREGDQDYLDYTREMSDLYRPDSKRSFADRDTMQWFWARRTLRQPEEKALAFAYSFMGIRIQCAQCHKHPFDQWSQDDYKQFTKFFTNVNFGTDRETRDQYTKLQNDLGLKGKRGNELRRALPELLKEGKVVPFQEVFITPVKPQNPKRKRKNNNRNYVTVDGTAKLLGDEVVDLTEVDDPRKPLMDWLRRSDNPYFARAFVNRVWANYFHQGIVSPTDDLSLANPPSNKPLLDYLTAGFIASDFDMKWLHREITHSDTYQRSWRPNDTNRHDERNFSRAVPRRLPAEVTYDALVFATSSDDTIGSMWDAPDKRAICLPGTVNGNGAARGPNYALTIFGRSVRESNCDCDRSAEPSLLQTVYLRNDADVLRQITARDGWLRQIAQEYDLKAPQTNNRPKRPANYATVIERIETQIADAKKKKQTARLQKLTKNLRQFKGRFANPEKNRSDDTSLTAADRERIVELAYLRTLSRLPTEAEQTRAVAHITQAEFPLKGVEDLLWALINTKEFIVNH